MRTAAAVRRSERKRAEMGLATQASEGLEQRSTNLPSPTRLREALAEDEACPGVEKRSRTGSPTSELHPGKPIDARTRNSRRELPQQFDGASSQIWGKLAQLVTTAPKTRGDPPSLRASARQAFAPHY